jgi:hypothetical protein
MNDLGPTYFFPTFLQTGFLTLSQSLNVLVNFSSFDLSGLYYTVSHNVALFESFSNSDFLFYAMSFYLKYYCMSKAAFVEQFLQYTQI